MVVDWTELVLPALLATGAPCGAPAQPTIEMQPDKRHKKRRWARHMSPTKHYAGDQSRHLILQVRVNDSAIGDVPQGV
ncbi:hypothetical protein WCT95_20550 [Pectobacterium versatile]|nr:hypothetical protein [Pectobacterium versatile]MCA6917663.1 hypothetical protein [Pectobacterium versatile]UEQ08082.1 hypothetical protein LLE50_14600 [Pectobacterium versatile]